MLGSLDSYVTYCNQFYKHSFMIVMDNDYKVIFVGDEYLHAVERTRSSILNTYLFDTTPVPEQNRIKSKITFEKVRLKKEARQAFISNLYHRSSNYHTLTMTISPILDELNNMIGIRLDFTPIDISYFFQIMIKIDKKIVKNDLPNEETFLTKREHQIAFLLCHCNGIDEITKIINLFSDKDITSKTVNNIICTYLFPKFNVNSKKALISEIHKNGYDKIIPTSLLSNQFIDLTRE